MNKYYKNSAKTKEPKLLYTQLCMYKKTERVDLRIEQPLKDLVAKVAKEKSLTLSETTRLLWIDYLQKTGRIEGYKKQNLIYGVDWEL
ncbi:MAG: hypothetical protein KKB34_10295 [Bacteroidetes bacterium]|nr:hypothetical protein [Bacteroidota bacterium]